MEDKKMKYWYWLCNIPELWNQKIRLLLQYFGSPEEVYRCKAEQLALIPGITEKNRSDILDSRDGAWKAGISELDKRKITFLYPEHKDYPKKLKDLTDAPYSLYVKGTLPDPEKHHVAIVGSRACSAYGKTVTDMLSRELAAYGIGVISGMARGIDTVGQRGVLAAGGKTYAVLGSGLDVVYPRENIELYEQILECGGGVISEYPLGAQPVQWRFPMRNRIISGLSDAVLVTEAAERSGSLITVEFALEQGKEIFALPGRITDRLSGGCNRLIQAGAYALTSVQDILNVLKINKKVICENLSKKDYPLEKEMEVVYSCLSLLPQDIHTIIEETGMEAEKVVANLVKLQILGLVTEPVRSYFARKG